MYELYERIVAERSELLYAGVIIEEFAVLYHAEECHDNLVEGV